jgi:hypothetical protein
MTQDEALKIVLDAAGKWSTELAEWIQPAAEGEDGEAYEEEGDDIDEAIKVLTPGIAGVESDYWFPMDLIERRVEVDGKMKSLYGQVVQVEQVPGKVSLWVALPGTNKPAMWPAAECRLLRRG